MPKTIRFFMKEKGVKVGRQKTLGGATYYYLYSPGKHGREHVYSPLFTTINGLENWCKQAHNYRALSSLPYRSRCPFRWLFGVLKWLRR